MANIETGGNDAKKGKPQRKLLRVDFTPMVDMNMLLITFFMFCTTLSIPQIMDIAMPDTRGGESLIPESKSLTVILGENDKVFYYEGKANYEDYTSLKETDYKGMRDILLSKNNINLSKIKDLRLKRSKKQISDEEFKAEVTKVNKLESGIYTLIKPTKDSNFKNLVDALDEMQICGVGKYMIVEPNEGDDFLMENLKTKDQLTAMAERPE
ncbi:biopolymer transporter ExbD [Bacteroidia bacterium]|nr:biopolymer transporter ExbD [Bacteroidia bacterium]GHV41531.1 biopolymer transporter ExbD [Bacteroidia bacterium]